VPGGEPRGGHRGTAGVHQVCARSGRGCCAGCSALCAVLGRCKMGASTAAAAAAAANAAASASVCVWVLPSSPQGMQAALLAGLGEELQCPFVEC